ncbi:MAG: hypothetical protein ACOH2Q_08655 [Rhodococcus sp. (in: high G+C Gram-positive bacteria)]
MTHVPAVGGVVVVGGGVVVVGGVVLGGVVGGAELVTSPAANVAPAAADPFDTY